jgi:hypothetical protein
MPPGPEAGVVGVAGREGGMGGGPGVGVTDRGGGVVAGVVAEAGRVNRSSPPVVAGIVRRPGCRVS